MRQTIWEECEAVARLFDRSNPDLAKNIRQQQRERHEASVVASWAAIGDHHRAKHSEMGVPLEPRTGLPQVRPSLEFLVRVLHQPCWKQDFDSPELRQKVDDGRLFVAAVPVISWARPNADHYGNQIALNSSGLACRYTGAPNGEDGEVIVPFDAEMWSSRGPSSIPRGTIFPLEVGYVEASRCHRWLRERGCLARLPYEIKGDLGPHLFLFATPNSSAR